MILFNFETKNKWQVFYCFTAAHCDIKACFFIDHKQVKLNELNRQYALDFILNLGLS